MKDTGTLLSIVVGNGVGARCQSCADDDDLLRDRRLLSAVIPIYYNVFNRNSRAILAGFRQDYFLHQLRYVHEIPNSFF